jgi:hypothetical protein
MHCPITDYCAPELLKGYPREQTSTKSKRASCRIMIYCSNDAFLLVIPEPFTKLSMMRNVAGKIHYQQYGV